MPDKTWQGPSVSNYNRHISSYVHAGRIGVLVEFDVSPFTSAEDAFLFLVKDVAMHIAASAPASMEALLQQPFVKEPSITVAELLTESAIVLAEEVSITRFVRWTAEVEKPMETEPPKSPAVIHRMAS
jgi:elongation factor Ts